MGVSHLLQLCGSQRRNVIEGVWLRQGHGSLPGALLIFCLFGLRQLEDGRVYSGSQFQGTQSVEVGKVWRQKHAPLRLLSGSRDKY